MQARPVDAFAVLGIDRRPWLDGEDLKRRFLELASSVHPDRVHGGDAATRQEAHDCYTRLNAAWQCLADPKERLGHLLALERGQRPSEVHEIPSETAALFLEVAELDRRAQGLATRRAAAGSPLLRVGLVAETAQVVEAIRGKLAQLGVRQRAMEVEVQGWNRLWEVAPPPGSPGRSGALPLGEAEAVWRALSYLSRWTRQLQEHLVQLAT